MVTCDPVKRLLSDFYHQKRFTTVEIGDFGRQFGARLSKMETQFAEMRSNFPETWFEEVYNMYKKRENWFNYTDIESNMIING